MFGSCFFLVKLFRDCREKNKYYVNVGDWRLWGGELICLYGYSNYYYFFFSFSSILFNGSF